MEKNIESHLKETRVFKPARGFAAKARLGEVHRVKARLTSVQDTLVDRWAALASQIDPRLTSQADWPALAAMMQLAHRDGHDVPATVRRLIEQEPLADQPAQDLRYRLVAALPLDVAPPAPPTIDDQPSKTGQEHDRRAAGTRPPRRVQTPRR